MDLHLVCRLNAMAISKAAWKSPFVGATQTLALRSLPILDKRRHKDSLPDRGRCPSYRLARNECRRHNQGTHHRAATRRQAIFPVWAEPKEIEISYVVRTDVSRYVLPTATNRFDCTGNFERVLATSTVYRELRNQKCYLFRSGCLGFPVQETGIKPL